MIKITDNYLPDKEFNNLKNIIMGKGFPWFFNDVVVNDHEVNDIEIFQFVHPFYENDRGWVNEGKLYLTSLLKKIDPYKILRIKANLNTYKPIPNSENFHEDFPNFIKPYFSSIFYLNTNNGYTLFKNGMKVESVENRLVTFSGNMEHTAIGCTDQKRRVIINFVYE